eukprot:scaffold258080_cov22-Tisochrysis_lutea.AAC.1
MSALEGEWRKRERLREAEIAAMRAEYGNLEERARQDDKGGFIQIPGCQVTFSVGPKTHLPVSQSKQGLSYGAEPEQQSYEAKTEQQTPMHACPARHPQLACLSTNCPPNFAK